MWARQSRPRGRPWWRRVPPPTTGCSLPPAEIEPSDVEEQEDRGAASGGRRTAHAPRPANRHPSAGLPLRQQDPSCRTIHQRQLRNTEGIKVWRQARDRASSGTQLYGPQRRKPGHKQKQHQSQWQRRRQQLQAALQNTTERESTGQLMAQQTGEGQQHRQQLETTGPQALQLRRQQAGGDQLKKSDEPSIKGPPAVPQLEQGAKHQGPGGPGEQRIPIQGEALQEQGQQRPPGQRQRTVLMRHAVANASRQASRWCTPFDGARLMARIRRP